jgi:hypothetical protein
MKHSTPPPDDPWESDAIWKLLDGAAPMKARDSFADDLVRMVRLAPVAEPWWKRLFTPAPITGLAAAAAVLSFICFFHISPETETGGMAVISLDSSAPSDLYDDLQDLAETETLIAAADHLDAFSDQELGNLIGF